MAAFTKTTADAALKEFYLNGVREQLNHEVMLLTQIESTSENVEGRRAVLSLHTRRNPGVGARAEGGTLPTAGSQQYVEERVSLKYLYGRLSLSGPVIRAMASDRGSFVRALSSETEGLVRDLKRDVNRQLYNDSTQSIAQCDTSTTTNEIELATTTTATQMRQFYIGQVVDIGTTASPASIASGRTITAIDDTLATASITIDGSTVSTTSSHYVTVSGSGGNEITGLREIVAASGTLFNVDPSSYPVWVSKVNDNSGTPRNFTDTIAQKLVDDVYIAAGVAPNFAVASHGVVRNYAAQLQGDRRYNDTVVFDGGFEAVSVTASGRKISLVAERDCPEARAFFLNTEHLTWQQASDWEWMDEDGSVLNRLANEDGYEATLFKYAELTTDKRNAHGLVSDLNQS